MKSQVNSNLTKILEACSATCLISLVFEMHDQIRKLRQFFPQVTVLIVLPPPPSGVLLPFSPTLLPLPPSSFP